MDKEIFDSMCDRYEARIRELDEKLERCYGLIRENAISEICVLKGGHEFHSDRGGVTHTCKFCDFTIECSKLKL